MEQLLMEVAQAGDINALYTALDKDPSLLEEIDKKPFIETPLHVAASAGQTVFALEIMRLKSSFAFKANKDGFSPMHVALQHGQIETALRLLEIHGDLVRVKGRAGITPLHHVVEQGNIDLLIQFLSFCPKAIEDVTIRNETAMHIALKNDKMEAFGILFAWIDQVGCEEVFSLEKKILSSKDNDGNTILQLAMSRRQTQVVKWLKTSRAARYLDDWKVALKQQVDLEPEDGINVVVDENVPSAAFSLLSKNKKFLRTDQRLKLAAQEGDANALNAILWEDPNILERMDQLTLVDTPLHIAAFLGKTEFALEIMRLKPSFARKVNRDGLSPLHLALENKRFETAFELLAVDKELVHVKAKDGLTPLHYAAKEGNADLLAELIATCPKSIEDLTARRETALHVAVKNNNMACLKILCNWLSMVRGWEVLTWTDFEGKNILDIAIQKDNFDEVVKFLRKFRAERMLKHKAEDNQGTRASQGSPLATMLRRKNNLFEMWAVSTYRFQTLKTKEDFSMILVAFTLIVTVTYQAVLSPPGGVWQGDPSLLFSNESRTDNTNTTMADSTNAKILNVVGKTIMPKSVWLVFSIFNTAAFVYSLQAARRMLFLRNNFLVRIVAYLLVCCYGASLYVIGPHGKLSIIPIILCVFYVFQWKILCGLYRLMVDWNRVQEIAKVVLNKCARSQD